MHPLLAVATLVATTAWLLDLAWAGWLLGVAVAAVVVLATVWRTLRRALPAAPQLRVADDDRPCEPALARLSELQALGWERIGPPMAVDLALPMRAHALVHRQRCVLATVHEVLAPAAQPRAFADLVSLYESGAMLTTASHQEAGCLPMPAGRHLQAVGDGALMTMLRWHEAARAELARRGEQELSVATIDAPAFAAMVELAMRQQHAAFAAAPVRTLLTTAWRVLRRRSPHMLPLAVQLRATERPARASLRPAAHH